MNEDERQVAIIQLLSLPVAEKIIEDNPRLQARLIDKALVSDKVLTILKA